MASNLKTIIAENAEAIENASGAEKAMAILAFASFLTSRALSILLDIHARGELDDQGALDMAKQHDAEAQAAWEKLKSETGG